MADLDGLKKVKDFHTDVPFGKDSGFRVKGAGDLGWGMKSRLSSIFNPVSGNTVMFAFDHGYFMGPVSGLERLDLVVPRIAPHVDVLMCTRGALRTCVSPAVNKPVSLRISSGSSMLDEDLSHEVLAVEIEDAIRLNASCVAVQTFIGADGEKESLDNLSRAVNTGMKYGMPTMGVVAVGRQMERTPRFFKLATRIVAELGAQIVKTYDCPELDEIVAACPVPIVIAGGKKIEEDEALKMAYSVMQKGAKGVDMGRNIFQSECPEAMAIAVSQIVHYGMTASDAYDLYKKEKERREKQR